MHLALAVAVAAVIMLGVAGAGGSAEHSASATDPGPPAFDPGEPGPYGVGTARFETIDGRRDDRPVRILAYDPAATDAPPGSTSRKGPRR